tara:strand:+ start:2557 stop:3987 length:1431 start_codon:yes stop_codon:yes gene_type:complete
MVKSNTTNLIDRTLDNLWKVWDELSISTMNYITGKPNPNLPPEDLERLSIEIEACITGIGDEASLRSRAAEIGKTYLGLNQKGRGLFIRELARAFGVDREKVDEAISCVLEAGTDDRSRTRAELALKLALEPRWRALLGRFTTLPEGVKFLVDMRAAMFPLISKYPDVENLSNDLRSMLSAWFDIGLLELVQIQWDSPASLLEKLIAYESVHAIRSWDDLKHRLDQDRRCFGFFHPNMPNEPLIFVQVALVEGISSNIDYLLDEANTAIDPKTADTAIFYSISNAQRGLDGISFGNFLIKRVVEELRRELPNLKTFSTLSPIPGLSNWISEHLEDEKIMSLKSSERKTLQKYSGGKTDPALIKDLLPLIRENSTDHEAPIGAIKKVLIRLAAEFLCNAKGRNGRAKDPVAHFHLSNGASIERINWAADNSLRGRKQSFGLMVNYRYNVKDIEVNSSQYETGSAVARSAALRSIIRN